MFATGVPLSAHSAGLSESSSPSAGNVVWTVALRELTEQLMSLRFLLIALLVLGLTPLAVYVGKHDFESRLEDARRLGTEQQTVLAGPDSKQIEGRGSAAERVALRAIRQPEPLSVLVRGLDGPMPQYWDFLPTGMESGPSAWQPQRLADVLGQLDLEFLVRVALGLLAILLAFDAISGEKELGTLRILLSQPISRSAVLTGKLAGGAVTLLVPLTCAFLLALLSSQLMGVDLLRPDSIGKVGLIFLSSAAYLLFCYALGLFVSSMASSQKTSLVVLLVIWVFAVLAIPPMASLIAKAIRPTVPTGAIQARKQSLDRDLRNQSQQEMGVSYREITGLPEGWADYDKYHQHEAAILSKVVPVLIDYVNKRRQLMSELDRDAERRQDLQNSLTRTIMAVSPAAAFANAATELAGTGDEQRAAWFGAAYRQQSNLDTALFEDPPAFVISNKGASFVATRRKLPLVSELPKFTPPRRDYSAVINRSLPSLALLIGAVAVFVLAGFLAFSRYDVR
jgi:ABC-type transport system involved in multi-copper enzyme maturation permease subunit